MDLLTNQLWSLLAATGIGLLIGTEREWGQRQDKGRSGHIDAAGIRTFSLVSLSGLMATWLPAPIMPWAVALGLLFTAGIALASYWRTTRARHSDTGITSEIVLVMTFVLGALTGLGHIMPATVSAVIIVTLLYFKKLLHHFSHSLSPTDIQQAVQFLIISIVILPVLPNRTFGPYDSLNPYEIWLMVVLISGIGFAGYAGIKLVGGNKGLGITGMLGGLVSSTAVTLSMSRLSHDNPELENSAALAITAACGIMFPRVLFLTLVIAPGLTALLIAPIAITTIYVAVFSMYLWRQSENGRHDGYAPPGNPMSLKIALGFGAFYGLIVLLSHLVQTEYGSAGLMALASLSGLSDVDAITLSASSMVKHGLDAANGAQAVLAACAVNTLVKLAMGVTFASRGIRIRLIGGLLPAALISLGWMFWV
ncbi:MAG: DUF4010 domain-containing protein [Gammaproteobacteria bacterium]|nr:DUF4010 domain-containing protein [Gammaproteobacteria bacterium]